MDSETGQNAGCRIGVVDGDLTIEPAVGDGPACKVVLGDGVHLTVNGQVVHERCELRGDETIEMDLGDEQASNNVQVAFDDLELEAVVSITGVTGVQHGVMDQTPSEGLTIWRHVVGQTAPPAPGPHDISTALSAEGVNNGLMADEVAHLVADPYSAPVVVARGTAPGTSVDAIITRHHIGDCQRSPLFCIQTGTLLASKSVPVGGADGVSVKGTPVAARPPADPELVAGDGAEIVQDSNGTLSVYATRNGRPIYDGDVVSVDDTVRFTGDIDVGTGDVCVFGSLEITGGVGEDRTVWVSGDLQITGGVEGARIEALGGLTLTGPCLHSTIHSGTGASVNARFVEALEGHIDGLVSIGREAAVVLQAAQERGHDGPFAVAGRHVTEQRHVGVREGLERATALIAEAGEAYVGVAVVRALKTVVAVVGTGDLLAITRADYDHAVNQLAHAVNTARNAPRPTTHVHYLQSSKLTCGGDLVLTGQGIFTSQVVVSGDFTCEGGRSTLRGGSTSVGGVMRAHELGAAGGARTDVILEGRTTTADRLTAQDVHPGVWVTVQGSEIAFDLTRTGLSLGVDAEGIVAY